MGRWGKRSQCLSHKRFSIYPSDEVTLFQITLQLIVRPIHFPGRITCVPKIKSAQICNFDRIVRIGNWPLFILTICKWLLHKWDDTPHPSGDEPGSSLLQGRPRPSLLQGRPRPRPSLLQTQTQTQTRPAAGQPAPSWNVP